MATNGCRGFSNGCSYSDVLSALVGLSSFGLATLGLKVRAGRFQASVFAEIRLELRVCPHRCSRFACSGREL
jgi:hypothetical protein